MKNILVVAEGTMAQNFVSMVSKRRVAQNLYHIVSNTITHCDTKENKNLIFHSIDPTSPLRIKELFDATVFDHIFIITDFCSDIPLVIKNISAIDDKIRIVVVNQRDKLNIEDINSNITIIYTNELISNHLFDNLPNVPKIAKNVGLGNGEVMEMHIPFGSSYAFRHIGSITQQKWKIVALYRAGKQILPTSATMIRPNDTLLTVGNPIVLDGIYKLINKRKGFFPEPFGKNIFLLLDLKLDYERAIEYIQEGILMLSKLENRKLIILLTNPTDMKLVTKIKDFQSDDIHVNIHFEHKNIESEIEFHISSSEAGIVLCSSKTFKSFERNKMFFDLRKLVYIFGSSKLENITKAFMLMKDESRMESVSSAVFDLCETFHLQLEISDFSSEFSTEENNTIERHYDAMAPLFNTIVTFNHKIANPIREILKMENIIEVAPYSRKKVRSGIVEFAIAKGLDFFLSSSKHPKLLIPYEASDL